MKAAVYHQYGGPEVLNIEERDIPSINDEEILIKVHYTTVNRTDEGFLLAKPFIVRFFAGLFRPGNKILGNEFSGEIIETGHNVTKFKKGDRVFGMNGVSFGCHAQIIKFKESDAVAKIPEQMSMKDAAALCEGAFYAWNYIQSMDIQPGTRILINGTTGAIGSAALQLIKRKGAYISAVCNTKNIELIKSLGADEIVDYLKEDFTKVFERNSFDYVFDAVGKSSFGKTKHLLKSGGVYLSTELGPWIQNVWYALWCGIFKVMPFSGGRKVKFPLPADDKAKRFVDQIQSIATNDEFKPVIDREYTLSDIRDAYRCVLTGEKTGNVLVNMT